MCLGRLELNLPKGGHWEFKFISAICYCDWQKVWGVSSTGTLEGIAGSKDFIRRFINAMGRQTINMVGDLQKMCFSTNDKHYSKGSEKRSQSPCDRSHTLYAVTAF